MKRATHGPLGVAAPTEAPWSGPVEHRDPATYQRPSVHLTWWCPACRHWTMRDAWKDGVCDQCRAPRPDTPAA